MQRERYGVSEADLHFIGDITAGSVANIVTMIVIAIGIGVKVGSLQAVAQAQAAVIVGHTMRLDKYEERLVSLVSDVSRIMGRIEATQERLEKTTGFRPGEGLRQLP